MRKVFALLLFLFPFLPLAFAALGLIAINGWILDRDFYTSLVDDPRFYDVLLREDLPAQLVSSSTDTSSIPVAALAAGLQQVVTTDYLREQAVTAVNTLFDYIESRTSTLRIVLDLAPVKATLATQAGRDAFSHAVADNLPRCARNQSAFSGDSKFPVCIPDNGTTEAAFAQIEKALPAIVETLPNELPLVEDGGVDPIYREWFPDVRNGLTAAVSGIASAALVMGVVIALIGGDGMRGKLRWMGDGLLLPGLIILAFGLAISQGDANWLNQLLANNSRSAQEISPTVIQVFQSAVARIGDNFVTTGGIAAMIGLAIFVLGTIFPGAGRSGREVEVPVVGFAPQMEKPKRKQKPVMDDDPLAPQDDPFR
ncbi:MAG: hypothetical protein K8I60_19265 [Anaerolineae bacterium]|nr:hypothetical protein [Anaerolineae bacterium]